MDKSFYTQNRQTLYASIPGDALIVVFAGNPIRQSADAYYRFYPDRNFVYLTGLGNTNAAGFTLLAEKKGDAVTETLFILPPDAHLERWNGVRVKVDEAKETSGVEDVAFLADFPARFHRAINASVGAKLCLPLDRLTPDEPLSLAHRFVNDCQQKFPYVQIHNLLPQLKKQRVIKQPCEIESMKKSMEHTKAGVLAMMKTSKPGMMEYEYKAAWDAALTGRGCIVQGFQPIISAGQNNFCIHYDAYMGQAMDGDMILVDVGASHDFLGNDVSRGFPCNGVFSDRMRKLYTCAYNTSEYMFSILKPGFPMDQVDLTARKFNYEQLKGLGLVDKYEDVGKLIWHGGGHHVGFDTHDVVDASGPIRPGMVFCVDVGIYCEEWGIGFRLEDNCLITEDGCENLSREIPRSIEDIEAAMRG